MYKFIIAVTLALALAFGAGPVFAQGSVHHNTYNEYNNKYITTNNKAEADVDIGNTFFGDTFSPKATATIERGAVQVDNKSTAIQGQDQLQGQMQGQVQGQGQQQVNEGNKNSIKIINPRDFIQAPFAGVGEINYGFGLGLWDIGDKLPKFGIKLLSTNDEIVEIVDVSANIPFKKLYKKILSMKKSAGTLSPRLRMQIVRADAVKTINLGVGSAAAGSGMLGAVGAAGTVSPQTGVGSSKANPLYTIVFVHIR